ncbi:MAG: ComEC/Rec2 family competence protein [Clostridia bacterium]|nr:ComEC/Rec2 family competence protein [Clostridia bacterium]
MKAVIYRPLFWMAIIGIAAIAVFSVFPSLFVIFAIIVITVIVILLWTPPFRAVRAEWLIAVFLLLGILFRAGQSFQTLQMREQVEGKTLSVRLTVVSCLDDADRLWKAYCVDDCFFRCGVTVKLLDEESSLAVGERISAKICFSSFQTRDGFSSLSDDFYGTATLLKTEKRFRSLYLLTLAGKLRAGLTEAIRSTLPPDEAATLLGLTVGDRSTMPSFLTESVRRAGIPHLFVVSGQHLMILIGGLLQLLQRICHRPLLNYFSVMAAIVLFCAVCGFSDSVMRSGWMFLIALSAPLFYRESDSLNCLGLAVIMMLLLNPLCVFHLSFRLSVLATVGIIVLYPALMDLVRKHPATLLHKIAAQPVLTLSAMIMTAPVAVGTFGQLSIVAPITNLFVSFAVGFTLIFAFIGGLGCMLPGISFLGRPFLSVAGMLAKYLNETALFFGRIPFAAVRVPPACAYFLWVLAFAIILFFARAKKTAEKDIAK